ncbi:NLI interacting factor-like phosphatase [Aquisphaera giovannonii]|uniref:NLI interacting factor-like phosphatase n=1 Tax=Aquisphaera giovannonii TaxID=406548 RepID=A0A5B9WC86_9BACT|nr:HAD family hydrolase [Aquisphaera giovannonii]QEH38192.1 NLI interacting factor-like phosphatase [Aquisphaera giovannonii]
MQRPLLILDLDETLAFATTEARPDLGVPDFRVGEFAVHRRPYLGEFLRTVASWYDLAVWSSASAPYVAGLVGRLFADGPALRFIWSSERCTRRYHPETQEYYWVKDLKKVKRAGFALERVLMIDDTPAKLERNYGNHLRVLPFEGQAGDVELRNLIPYLGFLRDVEDLRAVEKRDWRLRLPEPDG